MRHLPLVAGIFLVSLLGSAACSSLPVTGEPHEFAIEAPQREPIRQFGFAPQPGSSPTVLLEDFLLASAAGNYDDFATARLYLTPEASLSWRPDAQVAVFAADFPPELEMKDRDVHEVTVSLSLTTVGTVSEQGVLSASATPGSASREFTLVQNADGEWRISGLEDGLILSQSTFSNSYQASDLFFPSTDLTALVPDPRWYPRARLASHLVKGLLEGPVEALAPAVAGDLPADLTLPTAGVEVVDRVAMVNLEGTSSPDEADREALAWQITQTLRQVPSVQAVEIKLNGVPLAGDDGEKGPRYRLDRAVAFLGEGIGIGSPPSMTEIVDAEAVGPDAADPVIGPLESSPIAWMNPSEGRVAVTVRGSTKPRSIEVKSPAAISVDRHGVLWIAQTGAASSILAVPRGAEPVEVSRSFEGEIHNLTVSPDGSRISALTESESGSTVVLATIVRDSAGTSFSLEEAANLTQFSPHTADITWIGETMLAALVLNEDRDPNVELMALGGWLQKIAAPEGVKRITAGGTLGSLVVQTADGVTYQRAGAAWVELPEPMPGLSFAG